MERVVRWRVDNTGGTRCLKRWRHCGVSRRIFAPSVTSKTSSSGEADPPAPRSYHRAAAGRSISLRLAQWINNPGPVFCTGAQTGNYRILPNVIQLCRELNAAFVSSQPDQQCAAAHLNRVLVASLTSRAFPGENGVRCIIATFDLPMPSAACQGSDREPELGYLLWNFSCAVLLRCG